MNNRVTYKLLTPGPLSTSETVKQAMMTDHCTWDNDYKAITQKIRRGLLDLARCSEENYTAVLMQGSGTFGVESAITSSVGKEGKLLILANGAYGERMEDICRHAGLRYRIEHFPYWTVPDAAVCARILDEDPEITHVSMVHSETTSGILNDIASVAKVVKARNRVFIVDAMSSFAGVEIPVEALGIDFIITSANKCVQGVPGFAIIICKRAEAERCKGRAVSLSLDLYEQWKGQEKDGKWRFTSPTHTVLAFAQAMEEMEAEGGIKARAERYARNNRYLIGEMKKLGYRTYVPEEHQGPIITTFCYQDNRKYTFRQMYDYIKERGYAIYPGKVTEAETFRIGNIGEIWQEDIEKLIGIYKGFLAEYN